MTSFRLSTAFLPPPRPMPSKPEQTPRQFANNAQQISRKNRFHLRRRNECVTICKHTVILRVKVDFGGNFCRRTINGFVLRGRKPRRICPFGSVTTFNYKSIISFLGEKVHFCVSLINRSKCVFRLMPMAGGSALCAQHMHLVKFDLFGSARV